MTLPTSVRTECRIACAGPALGWRHDANSPDHREEIKRTGGSSRIGPEYAISDRQTRTMTSRLTGDQQTPTDADVVRPALEARFSGRRSRCRQPSAGPARQRSANWKLSVVVRRKDPIQYSS